MKSRTLAWLGACLSALALAGSVEATSRLNFPRLSVGGAEITGLAIVNPTDQTASVRLTAYGEDGSMLRGEDFNNPVSISIPAGQQFSRITAEIFGPRPDPAPAGWVEAFSETEGLTGFFLFLNQAVTFFDGADLPRSATSLIFNDVRLEGDSTELNLINPGNQSVEATVRLIGAPGALERRITIRPKGIARLDAAEFFGLTSAAGGNALTSAYVTVTANAPVAGFGAVRGGQGDLLGLNAAPSTEALNTLFFPQLAVLDPFETQLTVINYSDSEDAILTITAFQPDGSLYGPPHVAANPVSRLLRAGGSLREDLERMFGFSGAETLEGWVRVESTAEAVNGSISYSLPESPNSPVAAVASLSRGERRAVFSHIATTFGFFTGLAVLNSGSRCANVRVLALEPVGTLLGSFSTTLLPRQRFSRLIDQLIPESAGQAGGMIVVISSEEVHMTALFGAAGVLANIPPQPIPSSFRPDRGLPMPRIFPAVAVASPSPGAMSSIAFSLSGAASPAQWSVNGTPGGDEFFGTVEATSSQEAEYTAPEFAPLVQPINVSAQADDLGACRSVDITALEPLVRGLGEVQSVTHLSGLNRLYAAEISAGANAGRRQAGDPLGSVGSVILDITEESPQTALSIPSDRVSKMIPLRVEDREYLLLAGQTSGTIVRFDPAASPPATTVVASDLASPTAMVLDEAGNLLVGDRNGIQIVSASDLRIAAGAPETVGPTKREPKGRDSVSFLQSSATTLGAAVDRCTGNVYSSEVDTGDDAMRGVVRERNASTQETRDLARLAEPGQLLGFYRSGLPCPSSFNLLALDPGAGQAVLLVPSQDLATPWVFVDDVIDLAFLPGDSGLSGSEAILFAQSPDPAAALALSADAPQGPAEGRISIVPVPNLYQPQPVNPPPAGDPAPAPPAGAWQGGYSWDCQQSTSPGSTEIAFDLEEMPPQPGSPRPRITGAVSYRGGTATIQDGFVYPAGEVIDVFWLDPIVSDGTYVSLSWDCACPFPNNRFIGKITGASMSGWTLNGDFASNPECCAGCSAPTGPAGTISVSRTDGSN